MWFQAVEAWYDIPIPIPLEGLENVKEQVEREVAGYINTCLYLTGPSGVDNYVYVNRTLKVSILEINGLQATIRAKLLVLEKPPEDSHLELDCVVVKVKEQFVVAKIPGDSHIKSVC